MSSESAAPLPTQFALPDGTFLPAVGLGTFQSDAGNSKVREAVSTALKLGYRHIDGAAAYGNEREVGEGLRDSGIPREEIFLTSKLSQNWHKPCDVAQALRMTLDDLQVDRLDLYLMHFPHAYCTDAAHNTLRHKTGDGKKPIIDYELSRKYTDTWRAMEELVEKNLVRFIGLSNFNVLKTRRILEIARIRPAVNQVELHPYLPQKELVDFCQREGIIAMAHQPLGGRPVAAVNPNASKPGPFVNDTVLKIASTCGISAAQVLLSWSVQRGIPAVPKSIQKDHLRENLKISRLSECHFAQINQIFETAGMVRFLDPSGHVGFDIFDETEDQPLPRGEN